MLLPQFSVQVLQGDASTLAMLSAANGAGALIAALLLTTRKTVVGMGRWIIAGSAVMGLGLLSFLFIDTLRMAMVALCFVGFGLMVQSASSNTLLQTIADPDKRARVMSFFSVAFLGMAPIGSVATGVVTEHFGLKAAWALAGIICIGSAITVRLRRDRMRRLVRPIYERLNLLPPLTEAINASTELRQVTRE